MIAKFRFLALAALGLLTAAQAATDYEWLICSHNNARVLRYDDEEGTLIDVFIANQPSGITFPDGMTLGPDRTLWVTAGISGGPIYRFDAATGAFLNTTTGPNINIPRGISVGPDGNLYVGNDSSRVLRFDGLTGASLGTFATGGGLGRAEHPLWGPDGHLYVSDRDADCVFRYNGSTGAFMGAFITGIDKPFGMTFGPDGHLYVCSQNGDRVQRHNGWTGAPIDIFATSFDLDDPIQPVFGPDRDLYVDSYLGHRVERFNGQTGQFIDTFAGGGQMLGPAYMIYRTVGDHLVVDGGMDGLYGGPLALQDTQTDFGDSTLGVIDVANGSELDAAYATTINGTLYLLLTGNLQSNFNKLEVFIDSGAGGQNRLRGDNPDVDFGGLNRMGDDGSGNGLTFDAGFTANHWLSVSGGDPGDGSYALYANYAELLPDGGGVGRYLGSTGAWSDGTLTGGDNPDGIRATIDNRTRGGVTAGSGAGNGYGGIYGVELAIPLSAIGGPPQLEPIRICAFVNGSGHDFLSNQVLAGIGGGGNLGEPRSVDFGLIPGEQHFVVPLNCAGDVSGDNDTDQADLGLMLVSFGLCEGDSDYIPNADLWPDGCVDQQDLGVLLQNFGCTSN